MIVDSQRGVFSLFVLFFGVCVLRITKCLYDVLRCKELEWKS